MKYSSEQMSTQITLFLKLLSVERNLTNRTLNAYRSDLHCFFLWCKHTQIETLDQNTILSYFHYLQTTLEQKASSIQRKYVSIHQFFYYINQEGLSSERFFRFSTRKFQLPKNLPRILPTAEIRRLLTAADAQVAQSQSQFHKSLNIRNNVILELLFCLGLRIGEISALNLEHYDSVDRTLLIHGKGLLQDKFKWYLHPLPTFFNILFCLTPKPFLANILPQIVQLLFKLSDMLPVFFLRCFLFRHGFCVSHIIPQPCFLLRTRFAFQFPAYTFISSIASNHCSIRYIGVFFSQDNNFFLLSSYPLYHATGHQSLPQVTASSGGSARSDTHNSTGKQTVRISAP